MPGGKKILGADAVCSVLLSYLRPSAKIDELFPNRIAGQRLDDLVAARTWGDACVLGNLDYMASVLYAQWGK